MEVRDRELDARASRASYLSTAAPPRMSVGSASSRASSIGGRSNSVDGERSWRPASGFASKHQAELAAKRLQKEALLRVQQERRSRADALARGPTPNDDVAPVQEGEWKTVVSHGRRSRAERRPMGQTTLRPPPFAHTRSGSLDGTNVGMNSAVSNTASHDELDEADLAKKRRRQQTKKRQKNGAQQTGATASSRSEMSPHPSFLGEVMFARRSSLQRLVDKLHVNEASEANAGSTGSRQWVSSSSSSQRKNSAGATQSGDHSVRRDATGHHHEGEDASARHSHAGYRTSRRSASRQESPSSGTDGNSPPPPRKCGDKRDFFFRNLEFEVRNQLQVDEVAEFSVTDFEMATKISEAVLRLFASPDDVTLLRDCSDDHDGHSDSSASAGNCKREKYPLVVTDGTACVGGNVLSFCDFFTRVNAIENDSTRVRMLQHNLQVLHKTNATCIHASYLDVMLELQQDVVFLDPPWGGPEYKDLDKVDLFLGDVPLYEICTRLRGNTKCVVLKVPSNFDGDKFAQHVPGKVVIRQDLKKMHLVILDFRDSAGEK
ncbi:hypothetical protein BBJ28_00013908 [Nothophytophthora sp. Chile5]|nr:hypothetical protein BBJ28_00013908 [Nothophytophthora sp. Chile5]